MSSSSGSLAQQDNTNDAFTIPLTIESISILSDVLSRAKASIPLPSLNTENITTAPIASAATTNKSDGDHFCSNDNRNDIASSCIPPPTLANNSSTYVGNNNNSISSNNVHGNNGSHNGNNSSGSNDGSCWILGCFDKKKNDESNKKDNSSTSNNSKNASSLSRHDNYQQLHNQLERSERDLVLIKSAFGKLQALEGDVCAQLKTLQEQGQILGRYFANIPQAPIGANKLLHVEFQASIQAITQMVTKLKLQISSLHKMKLANAEGSRKVETVRVVSALNLMHEMAKLPVYEKFRGCLTIEDFEENYQSLDLRSRHCLLCFSVFPEGAIVKKTLLMYWWIGEGLIDPRVDGGRRAEEVADEILKKFLDNGLIEPVIKKQKLAGFRMHPLIRYGVIFLAERAGFFNFDFTWNPTMDFSRSQRACLVKTEEGYSRQLLAEGSSSDLGKLKTLLNVNDYWLRLKAEWFSSMRNLNVLCLGRWGTVSEQTNHQCIKATNTEFLKGLKNMRHLKFLSLQGISRIDELPDTIWKLDNLRILDLKACHNLGAFPDKKGSFQRLTHLDISQCLFLNHMPKGLGSLTKLQVLKGFVISDSNIESASTLDDLAGLVRLRKLSIRTSKEFFPTDQELHSLCRIVTLRKLTIFWQGDFPAKSGTNQWLHKNLARQKAFRQAVAPELPKDLEKLDLRRYPETQLPSWLMPDKVKCLRKLYIIGGNLHSLGHTPRESVTWKVNILRLRFLDKLEMDWKELQDAFPDLIYLEKVKCHKLTSFPCDKSGVWLKREMLSEQLMKDLGFCWSFLGTRF